MLGSGSESLIDQLWVNIIDWKLGTGRPKTKFEFDLLDPEESLRVLENDCKVEKC